MLEWVRNIPAFKMDLTMFCVIITKVWWDILNCYMAWGQFAFFWIFQKNSIDKIFLESQKKQKIIAFILVNTIQYSRILQNNIYYPNKRLPPQFFLSDTNPVFGQALIHYFEFSGCTVERIWLLLFNILSFNFVPTPKIFMLGQQDSEGAI